MESPCDSISSPRERLLDGGRYRIVSDEGVRLALEHDLLDRAAGLAQRLGEAPAERRQLHMLDRGEKANLPPTLILQGAADENVSPARRRGRELRTAPIATGPHRPDRLVSGFGSPQRSRRRTRLHSGRSPSRCCRSRQSPVRHLPASRPSTTCCGPARGGRLRRLSRRRAAPARGAAPSPCSATVGGIAPAGCVNLAPTFQTAGIETMRRMRVMRGRAAVLPSCRRSPRGAAAAATRARVDIRAHSSDLDRPSVELT
jgi:hypothetical protein